MQLGELTWTEVAAHTAKVVVVPIGSLEQHGHHLPMLTDSLICAEIVRRAEAELKDKAVFLPLLWLGASDHHRAFPGTVSLSVEVYTRVLVDLVDSLIGAGFRRILLLNAHGGNIGPAQAALYELNLRHYRDKPDLWLTLASWFDIARKQVAALDGVAQPGVLHACEWETSAILRTHPGLVQTGAIQSVRTDFPSDFYSPDHSGETRLYVAKTIDQLTPVGALGRPELASAEKGEAILATAAAEVVKFIREFAGWATPQPRAVSGNA